MLTTTTSINDYIEKLENRIRELEIGLSILKVTELKNEKAAAAARKLQAEEYERRLEILNHEAEQLKQMQSTYLPRETWETTLNEITSKLTDLKAHKDNTIGRQAVISVVVSTLIGLGFVLLNLLIKLYS